VELHQALHPLPARPVVADLPLQLRAQGRRNRHDLFG